MSDNTMIIIVNGTECTVDCITETSHDGSVIKHPADTSNLIEVTRLNEKIRRFITETAPCVGNYDLCSIAAATIEIETEDQKRIKALEKTVVSMQSQINQLTADVRHAKTGWI